MRKYIDIVNNPSDKTPLNESFDFLKSLKEAVRPRRRRPLPDYEPEPIEEPENTLYGDLGDTPELGAEHLQNLQGAEFGADDVSDEEARRKAAELPNDEDFADFLHRKSVETGQMVPTLWRQIRNLPLYVLNNMRTMGRLIFGRLTDTPIEDIYVISPLFGDSDRNVRSMIEWLERHGEKVRDFRPYDFSNVMPGYNAKQVLFNVDEWQFLTVRDAHGLYVYAWKNDRGLHEAMNEDREESSTEKAADEGWHDAVVVGGTNRNKYPKGSPEHAAYENGFQNGLEELP